MKVVQNNKSKPAKTQPAPQQATFPRFELDFLVSCNRESVIGELRRLAGSLGKQSLSREDIARHGLMGVSTVMRLFGSLRRAHEAAGLVPARYTQPTDAELIRILAGLWAITLREYGRSPKAKELKKYGFPSSVGTILNRFGTWKKALRAVALAKEIPDGPDPLSIEVKPRPSLSVRRRYLVLERDKFQCRLCGRAGGELEVDHVIPFSRGGSSEMDNLQTLCRDCNRGKRNSMQHGEPVTSVTPAGGEIRA